MLPIFCHTSSFSVHIVLASVTAKVISNFKHIDIHAINQKILELRTFVLAEKNGNNNWRDPLTGSPKFDAEQIIQQSISNFYRAMTWW